MIKAVETHLGNLMPHYKVYKGVVEAVPADEMVDVPYDEGIVADRLKAAKEKLKPNTTYEEFTQVMEGARSHAVPARTMALLEKGFAGSITGLFDKVVVLEEVEDEVGLKALADEIDLHQRLPAKLRRGAKVVGDHGYYSGGVFKPFKKRKEK